MNMQTISQTFAQTLEINKVEFHPPTYGSHDVSVYCYFPYAKMLAIYGMSQGVYDRVNVQTFFGLLSVTFHLPITDADIAEAEAVPVCPF